MEPTDITIRVLTEIRDSIRDNSSRIDQTNERLDQTNERLDQTNDRLDQTIERLDQTNERLVHSEVRLATAISALGGTMEEVKALLKDRLDLGGRVENCEKDILLLKERTGLG